MFYRVANIVFNPFVNDSRVIKESISLSRHGYTVEVIAHGDLGLPDQEKMESFSIKRIGYLDRKTITSKSAKLKIYLKWIKDVVQYVKGFDILHCNDLNTLPIAFIVKKFYNKNIKIVYDAHEYETEVNGLKGIQKSITKYVERFLIRYVDKVITVSNAIAEDYAKLYAIPKPALVLNTPPFREITPKDLFREKFGIGIEKIICLYQGNLTKGRGIEILLETFKKNDDGKSIIVFMGYGDLEEDIQKASVKNKNIYFHQAVSPEILLDYTSSADFGISTIEDTCLSYRYSLPNKMFEYIMSDVPVIVSNLPEMIKVVKDNNIGVVVHENTPEGLKKAIKEAVELDKKELAQKIQKVKEIYNWEKQEKVLIKIYGDLYK